MRLNASSQKQRQMFRSDLVQPLLASKAGHDSTPFGGRHSVRRNFKLGTILDRAVQHFFYVFSQRHAGTFGQSLQRLFFRWGYVKSEVTHLCHEMNISHVARHATKNVT